MTMPHIPEDQKNNFWPISGVLLFALVVAAGIIFFKVGEMEQRIEWFKALGAIGTPIAIGLGLLFARGELIEQKKITQNRIDQLKLDTETKVAELYSRTASQLGSNKSESERIAALYMMERIANTYADYYQQCIDVLCAFAKDASKRDLESRCGQFVAETFVAPSELKVTVEILTRRKHRYLDGEAVRLNLDWVDFSLITFKGADFEGASFRQCVFNHTNFENCSLANCDFDGAVFTACTTRCTYFNGAQNMMLSDGSLTVYDEGMVRHPALVVRGEFPSHFALLEHNHIKQPDLVPIAMTLAGVGFSTTAELEPLVSDWGLWIRFLYPVNDKDNQGWWLEPVPEIERLLAERWYEFKTKHAEGLSI